MAKGRMQRVRYDMSKWAERVVRSVRHPLFRESEADRADVKGTSWLTLDQNRKTE